MQTQSMPVSNKDLRTQLHRLYQQKLAVDDLIASLMRYQRRTMGKVRLPVRTGRTHRPIQLAC
jgi:hypothetical protein